MRCKGNWILDALSKIVDLRGTWILCQNVLQNSFYLLSSLKPLIHNDILVKKVIHKKREEVYESIDILLQVAQEKSSRDRAIGRKAREVSIQRQKINETKASMRTCLKISKGEMLGLSFGLFLLRETYLILIFSIHFPSHPSHFDVFYAYSGV